MSRLNREDIARLADIKTEMILQKQDFVLPRNSFTGIGCCETTLDPRVSREYSSDEAVHAKI